MRKFMVTIPVVLSLAGCGGGHSLPYKTAPRPPLPSQLTVSACNSGNNHSLGQCLPKPKLGTNPKLTPPPGGFRCVDRSNNDPLYGVAAWRAVKAAGYQCAYFKVNESTGFVDSTAARMARDARAAGLYIGPYDFQHICGDAIGEAQTFARAAQADGLTGPNTLPGAGDAEFKVNGSTCNQRTWEIEWRSEASNRLHRSTITYTGAWYWNPNLGCFWPGGYAWISGYVGSLNQVPRPCGNGHIDLWQYTSTPIDRSVFLDSTAAFAAFVNSPLPPPRLICFGKGAKTSNPTCKKVRKEVVYWTGAEKASQKVYVARSCPVLAQRVTWFANAIRQHPRSPKTAYRKRALVSSRRAYARNSCAVFGGRVSYFGKVIKTTEAKYS